MSALAMRATPRGLLLFAHGARDPNWALPFEAIARRCTALGQHQHVVLGYLEFMSPNLIDCGVSLQAQGCTVVDVIPLFLGAGGHVRKDIPILLGELRQRYPAVDWRLQRAVGEADNVIEAMALVASGLTSPSSTGTPG